MDAIRRLFGIKQPHEDAFVAEDATSTKTKASRGMTIKKAINRVLNGFREALDILSNHRQVGEGNYVDLKTQFDDVCAMNKQLEKSILFENKNLANVKRYIARIDCERLGWIRKQQLTNKYISDLQNDVSMGKTYEAVLGERLMLLNKNELVGVLREANVEYSTTASTDMGSESDLDTESHDYDFETESLEDSDLD